MNKEQRKHLQSRLHDEVRSALVGYKDRHPIEPSDREHLDGIVGVLERAGYKNVKSYSYSFSGVSKKLTASHRRNAAAYEKLRTKLYGELRKAEDRIILGSSADAIAALNEFIDMIKRESK